MTDPITLTPLVPMFAYKKFWAVFLPDDDGPSIEVKAGWLADFLVVWAGEVRAFLASLEKGESAIPNGLQASGDAEAQAVQSWLESLAQAIDTLPAIKKRDYLIEIPESFTKGAHALFAEAERKGVRAEGLTVQKVALRLAAVRSHMGESRRSITIDEDGRVFDSAGERLFQFDPAKILRGMSDVEAGRTISLREIRAREGRNGH